MSSLHTETVTTARQRREFVAFPKRLYEGNRQWVPAFDADMRKILTRKHPYFEHSPGEFFLIRSGTRTVARAAALANDRYNREHGVRSVHFYFLDFEQDRSASQAAFAAVADWARPRGLDVMIGPLFSGATFGGGVLIDGFEHRAAMTMMAYNYNYYGDHYERHGFSRRFDLLSLYGNPQNFSLPGRIESIAQMVRSRGRLVCEQVGTMRELRRIADDVAALYNPTLADHPENYPLTERELSALKKDLLVIAQPELEKIIRYDGDVVGFLFTFPDLSAAMQRNRGKTGPAQILRLLRETRKTRKVIFNGMGILENYQRLGGNALLYSELVRSLSGGGSFSFDEGEMCQINEGTDLMLKDMETLGARPFKRHRVYEKTIR